MADKQGNQIPPPESGNNKWTSDVLGKGMHKAAGGDWTYTPDLPAQKPIADNPDMLSI